jgi:2-keto-4-pentenoate hydratase/2-oxohepta-3-ene-1,7-dioic acid hydratase in catechol pathway
VKLLNFEVAGQRSFGAVIGDGVIDLRRRLRAEEPDVCSVLRAGRLEAALAELEGVDPDHELAAVRILSPASPDARYFCIGVNYPDRNEEYRDGTERPAYPSVFMRTHSSFVAHEERIVRPPESEQLDYEGEIAVVIGRGGRRIAAERALSHVFGYTCANDGSVRDWLRHSKFNVTQGKNFDRSGAIGPWIATVDAIGPAPMTVTTRVDGETRQHDTSDRMLFPIPYLIAYLSTFCALAPGDVILTGTPSGAGARLIPPRYLRAGNSVEVEVSGVGTLRNTVVDEQASSDP